MTSASQAGVTVFTPIVSKLESQVAELDAMGAHVAAAHLDAAIHQLRLDGMAAKLNARG